MSDKINTHCCVCGFPLDFQRQLHQTCELADCRVEYTIRSFQAALQAKQALLDEIRQRLATETHDTMAPGITSALRQLLNVQLRSPHD